VFVFVEEAAEAVVSADVEMRDRGGAPVIDSGSCRRARRSRYPMGTLTVVVP
jgi:hypothetical protein